ncbi:hypothetical protein FNI11_12015 [Salmonella enterica subsp. salamae]|nr:hypothetical protein [Salmonella enterica subsp. salamae]ECJ2283577.1 hypothetical protein [Salmonella enterica subsp. salamae]HCC0889382.1 hypothetical protein [Salmonella enterica]
MENDFIINELYSYLGINSLCVTEAVRIEYEHGIELMVITHERNYIKLIISKKLEDELSYEKLFSISNMNIPRPEGESIIYSITKDNELILWLRMPVEGMVLNDLLKIMKNMHMEINNIINQA